MDSNKIVLLGNQQTNVFIKMERALLTGLRLGAVATFLGMGAQIIEDRSESGILALFLTLPFGLLLVGIAKDPNTFLWTWTAGQILMGILSVAVFVPVLFLFRSKPYTQAALILATSLVGFLLLGRVIISESFVHLVNRDLRDPPLHDLSCRTHGLAS